MTSRLDDRTKLVRRLELAYSGELAAAYAYRGHRRSLGAADPSRRRIRRIEVEEWHHRRLIGAMLRELGGRPRLAREVRAWVVGRMLGVLCRVAGWFLPMYGAGKLETRNVREYEEAAASAVACGRDDLVDGLLAMAEVEWEHEAYFRSRVEGHRWLRFFPLWPAPPPRESIRGRRGRFASTAARRGVEAGGAGAGASTGASASTASSARGLVGET